MVNVCGVGKGSVNSIRYDSIQFYNQKWYASLKGFSVFTRGHMHQPKLIAGMPSDPKVRDVITSTPYSKLAQIMKKTESKELE